MKTALVVYANGSEDLEVTAAADILNRGQVRVTRAALSDSGTQVRLAHGTVVNCDRNLSDCAEDYDAIVIPGGLPGAEYCRDSAFLISKLKAQKAQKKLIAAICAAPGFVLATHGILQNERATGYPGCDGNIKNCTSRGVEVSEDGLIITGKGPAFAVAFGLEILKALQGEETAGKVAAGMLV